MTFTVDPVSLITGLFDGDASGKPGLNKRAPFELRAGALTQGELEVITFRGRERVNDVYAYDVTFVTQAPPDTIHTTLLGAPVCLTLKGSPTPQVIQGIVSSLEALGGVPGERGSRYRRYALTIVPKLWLLKRRRVTRIFQGRTVLQIVTKLLEPLGLPPEEVRWRTDDREYPPLPFVYQRNESDYDFLRRVLASAGLFFYFEHATALPATMGGSAAPSAGASVSVGLGGLSVEVSVGGSGSPAAGSGTTVLNFARAATDTPAIAGGPPAPTTGEFGISLGPVSVGVGGGGLAQGRAAS